jgi:hypothetical protein
MVICGSDGLDADVADTVEGCVFFFPNQFIFDFVVVPLCSSRRCIDDDCLK